MSYFLYMKEKLFLLSMQLEILQYTDNAKGFLVALVGTVLDISAPSLFLELVTG